MRGGDVVLASIPQADGLVKIRPALVLCDFPPYSDLLLCGISTQLHQQVADFDDIITFTDTDFASSGLKATSLIRLGFLSVLPQTKVVGVIGSISSERRRRLLNHLSQHLISSAP